MIDPVNQDYQSLQRVHVVSPEIVVCFEAFHDPSSIAAAEYRHVVEHRIAFTQLSKKRAILRQGDDSYAEYGEQQRKPRQRYFLGVGLKANVVNIESRVV